MKMNRFCCILLLVSLSLDRLLTIVLAFSSLTTQNHGGIINTGASTNYYHNDHNNHHHRQRLLLSSRFSPTTKLYAVPLPDGYEEYGTAIIRKAAQDCGSTNVDEDIAIEWKPGKIIVTVNTQNVYMASSPSEEVDEEDEDLEFDDDEFFEENVSTSVETTEDGGGFDVTKLARAINYGLDSEGDEDSVGYKIAANHEIEVTTPGSSDEIQGQIMFDAYKGFDVTCQFQDLKSKKIKTIEGRLHERNDEFTVINIKGRMKKIKNIQVMSVKLPKAKREKGGK